MPPKTPSFEISNDQITQKFVFVLDDDEDPIKLGDGSFGVVYKARSNEDEYAVKLLYKDLDTIFGNYISLDKENLPEIMRELNLHKVDPLYKDLEENSDQTLSVANLILLFQKHQLPEEQVETLCRFFTGPNRDQSRVGFRYHYEMTASDIIKKGAGVDNFTGVINIIAGTKNFTKSEAYKLLKDKLTKGGVKVSDYAIVMPLFKYTLKELLERPTKKYKLNKKILESIPKNEDVSPIFLQQILQKSYSSKAEIVSIFEENNSLKKYVEQIDGNIYELNGYDLLRTMDYPERIATILPFLMSIAQGLKALHLARRYHYDLKPANIFVRQEGARAQTVIGDLGFFMVHEVSGAFQTEGLSELPLGTRHYRSPEQKDYFDICDAKVLKGGKLIIRDPKFRDTIIEEGDEAVFSKDNSIQRYKIFKKITFEENTEIHLDLDTLEEPVTDDRTQIIFYKKQNIRTDLFGFGALVFDMVTGGKSPERFYDKIKNLDLESNDLADIIESYGQVYAYQVNDPELLHVFSDFRDQDSTFQAPAEIVELILKCMMYKAQNTFYQNHFEASINEEAVDMPMETIFKTLKQTDNLYRAKEFNNPLIMLDYEGEIGKIESQNLSQEIDELYNLKTHDQLPYRLALGCWKFSKLVSLVRRTLNEQGKNRYFCELLPHNIIVKEDKLDFLFTTYKAKKNYEDDLVKDRLHAKITREITNPFVPNYLHFFRLKIELTPKNAGIDNWFYYRFLDSPFLGIKVQVGDWVIIDNQLCKITENVKDKLKLELNSDKSGIIINSKDENKGTPTQHIYYKDIDPCFYYLEMLGIYLYQIFFVNLNGTQRDKPLFITAAKIAKYLSNFPKPIQLSDASTFDQKEWTDLDHVYKQIINMYLKLTFPDHDKAYYSIRKSDSERILALNKEVNQLQTTLETFLGLPSTSLNDRPSNNFVLSAKINEEDFKKINFDALIRNYVSFNSNNLNIKNKSPVKKLINNHFKLFKIPDYLQKIIRLKFPITNERSENIKAELITQTPKEQKTNDLKNSESEIHL